MADIVKHSTATLFTGLFKDSIKTIEEYDQKTDDKLKKLLKPTRELIDISLNDDQCKKYK